MPTTMYLLFVVCSMLITIESKLVTANAVPSFLSELTNSQLFKSNPEKNLPVGIIPSDEMTAEELLMLLLIELELESSTESLDSLDAESKDVISTKDETDIKELKGQNNEVRKRSPERELLSILSKLKKDYYMSQLNANVAQKLISSYLGKK